ncbi:phospholipase-like protein [Hordeum vulgare]|nr:phospholipase-like protein [Hordeum vulgare]
MGREGDGRDVMGEENTLRYATLRYALSGDLATLIRRTLHNPNFITAHKCSSRGRPDPPPPHPHRCRPTASAITHAVADLRRYLPLPPPLTPSASSRNAWCLDPVFGVVAVDRGFTDESSCVAVVDHQGHSFSNSFRAHIPDIRPVLYDCEAAFTPFHVDYPPSLPCFLYRESLSGAITPLLHLRDKDWWPDGAARPFLSLGGRRVDPHRVAHLLSFS